MPEEKKKRFAGADEQTISKSEYFSWINNTNEGSSEAQTIVNLEWFEYLKKEFGMELDIYAWDAGNLDGAGGTYESKDSKKLQKQYPHGYGKIAEKAAGLGIKLGVWCGPDGFGNTPQEEKARFDLMVGLCKDFNFGLFKMDSVCGNVRKEKLDIFIKMMEECRKYSPELILLNHRLDLGKAEKYATTFLFEGAETYVDVHIRNKNTAMHHRAFAFMRDNVPGLKRLTEDHGVCISSCNDYFEDDMIIQAFGRCLILAPEIYGNPWLLKDDELPAFARVFNLHRRYRDILVNGIELAPKEYGKNAVSRGNEKIRFIVTSNNSWQKKCINISLDESIGLKPCEKVFVALRHPYESIIGTFNYGDKAEITAMPFRAVLVEICDFRIRPKMSEGVYNIIKENPDGSPNTISIPDNPMSTPVKLASAKDCPIPKNCKKIIEASYFDIENNSLEARSLCRCGETKISQTKKARDFFFNQKTYILRGPDSKFAFDGKRDTFFDGMSKLAFGGMRIKEGCLRVDLGSVIYCDSIIIEYFDPDKPDNTVISEQNAESIGSYSEDLSLWLDTDNVVTVSEEPYEQESVINKVHTIGIYSGVRRTIAYGINGFARYFTLRNPMDRIYKIAAFSNGNEVELKNPKVTNLMPHISCIDIGKTMKAVFSIDKNEVHDGDYLTVAIEGKCGREGVTVAIEYDEELHGCPDRAPSYPSNTFECPVRAVDGFYSYYYPLNNDMECKPITVYVIGLNRDFKDYSADIYYCPGKQKSCKVITL